VPIGPSDQPTSQLYVLDHRLEAGPRSGGCGRAVYWRAGWRGHWAPCGADGRDRFVPNAVSGGGRRLYRHGDRGRWSGGTARSTYLGRNRHSRRSPASGIGLGRRYEAALLSHPEGGAGRRWVSARGTVGDRKPSPMVGEGRGQVEPSRGSFDTTRCEGSQGPHACRTYMVRRPGAAQGQACRLGSCQTGKARPHARCRRGTGTASHDRRWLGAKRHRRGARRHLARTCSKGGSRLHHRQLLSTSAAIRSSSDPGGGAGNRVDCRLTRERQVFEQQKIGGPSARWAVTRDAEWKAEPGPVAGRGWPADPDPVAAFFAKEALVPTHLTSRCCWNVAGEGAERRRGITEALALPGAPSTFALAAAAYWSHRARAGSPGALGGKAGMGGRSMWRAHRLAKASPGRSFSYSA